MSSSFLLAAPHANNNTQLTHHNHSKNTTDKMMKAAMMMFIAPAAAQFVGAQNSRVGFEAASARDRRTLVSFHAHWARNEPHYERKGMLQLPLLACQRAPPVGDGSCRAFRRRFA